MSNLSEPHIHVADDALFDQHRSRGFHPERPERLGAVRRGLERCAGEGITLERLPARDASEAELALAHTLSYVEAVGRLAGHHAALDADTYVAPASVAAARRAAGATIAMVEAVLAEGSAPIGAALVRPPGHHATQDQGMGFCIFNNVAVAACWALNHGLSRVAIVDWDVHHGNGTQDIFWTDPRVLYVSLHEAPLYPGTGRVTERGEGAGAGYTVNVPLSAGATDAVYRLAFEEVVLPAVRRFGPELVLVSAGFDAHERDPLASMRVTEAGYGWMARALREVARESARGRVGLVLEGGYDLTALEGSVAASVRGLVRGEGAAAGGGGGGGDGGGEGDGSAEHRGEVAAARAAAGL